MAEEAQVVYLAFLATSSICQNKKGGDGIDAPEWQVGRIDQI